jgi:hypothetical protein
MLRNVGSARLLASLAVMWIASISAQTPVTRGLPSDQAGARRQGQPEESRHLIGRSSR